MWVASASAFQFSIQYLAIFTSPPSLTPKTTSNDLQFGRDAQIGSLTSVQNIKNGRNLDDCGSAQVSYEHVLFPSCCCIEKLKNETKYRPRL